MISEIIVKSSYRKVKGLLYQSKNFNSIIVILLYPFSKDNSIPEFVTRVLNFLQSYNFNVFLFNFQGVDSNFDIYDYKKKNNSELLELISILGWVHKNYTEENKIWLFSFFDTCQSGLHLVMRRPEITNYILFSPSLNPKLKDLNFVISCSATGLIVYETNVPNSANDIMQKMESKSDIIIDSMPFNDVDLRKNINTEKVIDGIKDRITNRKTIDEVKKSRVKKDRRRRKKSKNLDGQIVKVNPVQKLNFD